MSSLANKKASCWSITINNPTQADYDAIDEVKSKHWFKGWLGQLEEGAEGTPHVQAMLTTSSIILGSVKKVLTRAHIEPAKNASALAKYVSKEETRVGLLPESKAATSTTVYNEIFEIYSTFEELEASHKKYADALRGTDPDRFWDLLLHNIGSRLIRKGYVMVEMCVVNPLFRSGFKEFWRDIAYRTYYKPNPSQCPVVEPPPEDVAQQDDEQQSDE